MLLIILFFSLVFAQELVVFAGDPIVYVNGTRSINIMSDEIPFSAASRHVNLTPDEGLLTQTLYGKNGQIVSTSQISSKKIIIWIKQQELTVFKDGFHKPKEELPLKWEIPYRIFSNDFEQLSFRLWSGIKLK